jgi:hypothetical protein
LNPSKFEITGNNSVILPAGSTEDGTLNTRNVELASTAPRVNSSTSTISGIKGQSRRIDTSIVLYMPENLSVSYNADWGSAELGGAGSGSNAFDNLADQFRSGGLGDINFKSAVGEGTVGEKIKRDIAGIAQNFSGLNVRDLIQARSRIIANPHIELLFRGVQNRQFQFDFTFTPKNEAEAVEVRNIIKAFKFHMSPDIQGGDATGAFMRFPSEFDVTFYHNTKENQWLHKISTCALTDMQVNESGSGETKFHENGAPIATTVSLSFTELEIMTKKRIQDGF